MAAAARPGRRSAGAASGGTAWLQPPGTAPGAAGALQEPGEEPSDGARRPGSGGAQILIGESESPYQELSDGRSRGSLINSRWCSEVTSHHQSSISGGGGKSVTWPVTSRVQSPAVVHQLLVH